jgi:hypothetical protein
MLLKLVSGFDSVWEDEYVLFISLAFSRISLHLIKGFNGNSCDNTWLSRLFQHHRQDYTKRRLQQLLFEGPKYWSTSFLQEAQCVEKGRDVGEHDAWQVWRLREIRHDGID